MRGIKVSFEDSEFEELRKVAKERGFSSSQLIREAVRRMLEQEREQEEREKEALERMEAWRRSTCSGPSGQSSP
jgi:metal-responsive CopG/Arc/MetJ family transcriptional regulator